jgi:hypothetical protein
MTVMVRVRQGGDLEPCRCLLEEGTNWYCACTGYPAPYSICAEDQTAADTECTAGCLNLATTMESVTPIYCYEQDSSITCTNWNPSGEVTYASGTYYLDFQFVSGLVADSEPLVGCDDATILLTENGFEIGNANSGELLYEVGLRNGDVILSLNSIDLDGYPDVAYAFAELWLNGETDYTLVILRSSVPTTLYYNVYVTFP